MSTDTQLTDPQTAASSSPAGQSRPSAGWLEAIVVFTAMTLAAISLSAVFVDFTWLPSVLVCIGLIVIVGAIFRSIAVLRASGTAVIAQCVIGLLTVLMLNAGTTMVLGVVPTGGSFTTVIDLLSAGVSDLYAAAPPADSTPGFTAMLTIAFTLITILIDGLVSDLKAPKVGGVLLLVLWMIPVFFAPAQVRWWHVAAILAAFLLLMLSPYLPSTRWRGGLTAIVAGALAIGIGIGMPVLLPPVPTLPNRAANDQGDLTVTNPFLDLRQNLGERDDSTLFTYQTTGTETEPVRLTSIDDFDGQNWSPSPFALDPFAIAVDGMPWPPGMPRDENFKEETIDVSISDDFNQQYLPTPYAPQQPHKLDRRWIFDEKTLTIVGNGEKTGGLQYSMDYLSPDPSVEDLKNAAPVDANDFETELEVPETLPSSVTETAEKATADADNQWEAAVMLQAYFRSGEFEYSLDAPEKASGDAISDFLADKKGYCVQFSSAMTIMARTMGIPARIGVGFAGGEKSGEGYDVSMQDSHAWPELYFEGAGWVRFEPTPGGPAGDPPEWTLANGSSDETGEEETSSASPSEEPSEGAAESAPASEEPTETATTEAAAPAGASFATFAWAGLIVVVVLLLAAIPAIWRLILRSRRTRDPEDLEAVWTEVRALATDYGQSLDMSRTLRHNQLVLADGAVATSARGATSAPDRSEASVAGAEEPARKPAAEAASGAGAPATDDSVAESVGTSQFERSNERLSALRSPAPAVFGRGDREDTSLAAFIDALEAHRYGTDGESIDQSEVRALVDEVGTDLSERASAGSRISAKIWPASIFHPPR